jgi:hypothetical protein
MDPDNDGSEICDEAADRDDSTLSVPWAEYYWRFGGLIRTENIPGPFVDHGDGTASRSLEVLRTGGTFKLHGDLL